MAAGRISFQDMLNPVFLHPSDSSTSIQINKLQGPADYRAWRRTMEINLASKRKLGFVTGTVPVPTDDEIKVELWETCNNMVIAWLTNNLSSSIRKSVMYMTNAKEIWLNLEKRFSLTNGSRKYKLNKDLFEVKQNVVSINEYYTSMRSMWEELDTLNMLPVIAEPSVEVKSLLDTIELHKEESRLFQFLNGIDDVYSHHRSQLLMLTPLPNVENACAVLMQEEAQRALLHRPKIDDTVSAMNVYNNSEKLAVCNVCNKKAHTGDKCWFVVGFPKRNQNPKTFQPKAKPYTYPTSKWNSPSKPYKPKLANNAHTSLYAPSTSDTGGLLFSPQQLAQLAKLLPQITNTKHTETDDELDVHFSGMLTCQPNSISSDEWIVDSGASDHMTPHLSNLEPTSTKTYCPP
ncbi:uncharacterized protein LOC104884383 [Beta vulgaris subsp. vulgaris]|uniref:uncharacterized protein LOC104884383 n=1 Tax=Beta vulgaris subsp. vulgaris TaxID=3555 RepID=UPI00053F7F8B|nr:uncharacterized protein LOC104884383 [Beta vulgaris subsp. vulgaris]XP_048490919.1 uncharacterized protein LOC104884383 [Beta vulgaris subsp. vulgaris]XP_048490920.1 uncharacterized protein LOC104884383 [Beta vulgaris subsp. vulgaris]